MATYPCIQHSHTRTHTHTHTQPHTQPHTHSHTHIHIILLHKHTHSIDNVHPGIFQTALYVLSTGVWHTTLTKNSWHWSLQEVMDYNVDAARWPAVSLHWSTYWIGKMRDHAKHVRSWCIGLQFATVIFIQEGAPSAYTFTNTVCQSKQAYVYCIRISDCLCMNRFERTWRVISTQLNLYYLFADKTPKYISARCLQQRCTKKNWNNIVISDRTLDWIVKPETDWNQNNTFLEQMLFNNEILISVFDCHLNVS